MKLGIHKISKEMQAELCLIEFHDRGLHPVDRFIDPSKVRYLTLAKSYPRNGNIPISVYYDQLYKCFWIFIGSKIRIKAKDNGKSVKVFKLIRCHYSVMHENNSKFEYIQFGKKETKRISHSINRIINEYNC